MIKKILTDPNKVLRKKSLSVTKFNDPKVQKTIQDLKDTLRATKEGLGLAAPQIGANLRIFVLDVEGSTHIFINPEITNFSKKVSPEQEGCLSVPRKSSPIKRSIKIIMKYYDEEGIKHKIKVKGILAQAFQHEIDHLNGILYIDK